MAQPRPDFNATVRLFPRRKKKGVARPPERGRSPMRLGNQAIVSLFGIPQADAACQLGISLTTLKLACRKLGISRWPYTRRRHGINEADAGSCHCPTSASQGGAVGRTHSSEETMHAGERAVQTYQRHQLDNCACILGKDGGRRQEGGSGWGSNRAWSKIKSPYRYRE
jgi:hypothetical protein